MGRILGPLSYLREVIHSLDLAYLNLWAKLSLTRVVGGATWRSGPFNGRELVRGDIVWQDGVRAHNTRVQSCRVPCLRGIVAQD